jgi:caa(3)-type oxidase subunit IV
MNENKTFLRTPAVLVFIVLMIATIVSWWIGQGSGFPHTAVIVISIAFIKCFLVGLYFMEIIHAPDFLRLALLAWCGAGLIGINGIYLFL